MGGGWNGCFLGHPDFASFVENAFFSRVLVKNRGAPKTAVPTTTHPIPHLTPSEKQAGVKRACPNKVMAHIWFMHDAHLGRALFFLDMLAE